MEGFFVTVQILVIKIGVFIEPETEAQSLPAPPFVEDNLAALKLRTFRARQTTTVPDDSCLFQLAIIRPKDRPGFLVLRGLKQKLRIDDRHIIRVQQQDILKRRVQDGIRLEFPTAQDAGWMLQAH